jgi:Ca2+-binding EF-hand superfamily protein
LNRVSRLPGSWRAWQRAEHPLDFLLEGIAEQFEDGEDLDRQLDSMFALFDCDQSGTLSFTEFSAGLAALAAAQAAAEGGGDQSNGVAVRLDEGYLRDWDVGEDLEREDFKRLMRRELRR